MATDEFCEVKMVDGVSIIRFQSSHILEAVTIDRIASRPRCIS